jgi:hypothetical protein
VAVCLAALFLAHASLAQNASVTVSDCKQSMTSTTFLELLNTIIAHGDLSDVSFFYNTFGTKLSPSQVRFDYIDAQDHSAIITIDFDHAEEQCLNLIPDQFLPFFGRQGFHIDGTSPPSSDYYAKTLTAPGKGDTTLQIIFGVDGVRIFDPLHDRRPVLSVMLRQQK